MDGMPGQPVQAVSGQTYGEGVRQEALQRAMPAPKQPGIIPPPPTRAEQSASEAEPETQAIRPRLSFEEAMQQVGGKGGILALPDDNPSLPVSDGLATGPGRGPEMLTANSTLGNTLRRLANQTGDPIFRELASKVRF